MMQNIDSFALNNSAEAIEIKNQTKTNKVRPPFKDNQMNNRLLQQLLESQNIKGKREENLILIRKLKARQYFAKYYLKNKERICQQIRMRRARQRLMAADQKKIESESQTSTR
jgi:hypothetical protein